MKRNFNASVTISYTLLTSLIIYFINTPIIISPFVSDVIFLVIISALVSLLVYISFLVTKLTEIIVIFPAAVFLVFFVRAIPNIILAFPPFADPYYHYICTINIFEYGTTESNLTWWYSQSGMQLNWPILHILTIQLSHISGLDLMFFFRWLMPFVGAIFFFGIFIFAFKIFNKFGTAFLAALLGSLSMTTIFYQSEFHPQGLALTLFIFVLIGFFNTRSKNNAAYVLVALIFVMAFTLSHHFSTLLLSLICAMAIVITLIIQRIPYVNTRFKFLSSDISFLIIIVISILGFYVYTNFELLRFLFTWSLDLAPITGGTVQGKMPFLTSLLNSTKWIPIIIVIMAIPTILRQNKSEQIRALFIIALVSSVGLMSMFLFFMPLDRMLALIMPIIGVICAIVIYDIHYSKGKFKKYSKYITLLIIVTMIAGIIGSQSPAFFFQSSEPDSYYWYSNDPPDAIDMESSGLWSVTNIERNSTFGVTQASWAMPFYYGKNPVYNIKSIDDDESHQYLVVLFTETNRGEASSDAHIGINDKIFSGSNIVIYSFNGSFN